MQHYINSSFGVLFSNIDQSKSHSQTHSESGKSLQSYMNNGHSIEKAENLGLLLPLTTVSLSPEDRTCVPRITGHSGDVRGNTTLSVCSH